MKIFNPVEFKMKFRAFFATLAFVLVMALIFCVAFFEPVADHEIIKYALSFLLGSLLTAVITFYFDGNETQTHVIEAAQLAEAEADADAKVTQ